jgi:chromosome segregation ATPase
VGKFIPVEPEKWAEMVKAQAEVARLKAEVERLTSDLQMEKENEDRLVREWQKANNEVYGLQRQVAALIDDQTRLKAEVERLTKAGDAMYNALLCSGCSECEGMYNSHDEAINEWNAAKEGKQS